MGAVRQCAGCVRWRKARVPGLIMQVFCYVAVLLALLAPSRTSSPYPRRRTCFCELRKGPYFHSPLLLDVDDDSLVGGFATCRKARLWCPTFCYKAARARLINGGSGSVSPLRGSAGDTACQACSTNITAETTPTVHVYATYRVSNCHDSGFRYFGRLCCWAYEIGSGAIYKFNEDCQCGPPPPCDDGYPDACPTLFSSVGCPSTDQYCTTSANGNVCTAKLVDGATCIQAGQCQSDMCQSGLCISNECPTENSSAGCIVATQFCQTTPNGRRCVSKLSTGSVCVAADQCTTNICGTGFCDGCPTPNSVTGCPGGMFCAAGGTGNMCTVQLAVGMPCVAADQCTTNLCGTSFCDGCPTPNSITGCPSGMFCAIGGTGNMCAAQLAVGMPCITNDMCMTDNCDPVTSMCI